MAPEGALANAAMLTANGRPKRSVIARQFEGAIGKKVATPSNAGSLA